MIRMIEDRDDNTGKMVTPELVGKYFTELEEEVEEISRQDIRRLTDPNAWIAIEVETTGNLAETVKEVSKDIINGCRELSMVCTPYRGMVSYMPKENRRYEDPGLEYERRLEDGKEGVKEAVNMYKNLLPPGIRPEPVEKAILRLDAYITGREKESIEELDYI